MDQFDWKSYIDTYKDLQEAGINTKIKAWNHWIDFGQKEGRNYNLDNKNYSYKNFDWEKYLEKYIDLKQVGIKTKETAWDHWIYHGQFENRDYIYFQMDIPVVNLIGITDIVCSISDNLYMMKNYIKKTHRVNIINYKKINSIIIDNTEKYIFCLQPFEMNEILWFLDLFDINNKPEVLWIWEFKSIPNIFKKQEKYFSKIYVQSNFCYNYFLDFFNTPVEKIKLQPKIYNLIDQVFTYDIKNKNIINLLEKTKNKIKFGYCFDLNSSILRKNVLNLLKGFTNLNRDNIVLILKFRPTRNNNFVNNLEKDQYLKVINLIDNNKIFQINEEVSDLELYKLYTNFDYYISPHVSEGYGLTIEENLVLGVKIISTFYSGEKDFLIPGCFTELPHEEKEIYGLKEHPTYGQMSSCIGAYISADVITKTLEHVLDYNFNDLASKKKTNNKQINDEQINNEQINNEQINDEQINNEQINDEQINDEQINDEQINDEQINDEQINDEQINDNIFNTKSIKPEKDIPSDVFNNYLFADKNYLIVKDPKHSN